MLLCGIHVKSSPEGLEIFLGAVAGSRLEGNDQGTRWLFAMVEVLIADICLTYFCFFNEPGVRVMRKTEYTAVLFGHGNLQIKMFPERFREAILFIY